MRPRAFYERTRSEESPGSTGQGCLITSGEGDFKDSATENNRRASGKDEKARQELTGTVVTLWPCKPHPEQHRI